MNKVFLIGNLTRDPELTETTSGVALCRFAIAVNRNYGSADGERKTDFFNIVAWRGLGETVARYAKKGNKVAVSGSIELRNYEDSQGVKRTGVDIVAQDVEFLTPKGSGDGFAEAPSMPSDRKKASLQAFDDDTDIPF
ncbi:MAG: single-stranded DNA-binding protein [Clostridia bacterium]|nr:single-stranded DNA-binding protein [Clostridia bacterium]